METPQVQIPISTLLGHGSFVRSLAQGLLRDEQLAEDVVQDTWVRWLETPPREQGRPGAWLRKVARSVALNLAGSRAARRAREEVVARPEAAGDPVEELAQAELLRNLVDGVLALQEPLRATILLTFFRDWSAPRIASELSIPASTVRARLKQGLAELRRGLDEEHDGRREQWCALMLPIAGRFGSIGAAKGATLGGAGLVKFGLLSAAVALSLIAIAKWKAEGSTKELPSKPLLLQAAAGMGTTSPKASTPAFQDAVQSKRQVVATPSTNSIRVTGRLMNHAYEGLSLPQVPASDQELLVKAASGNRGSDALSSHSVQTDREGHFDLEFEDPGVRPLTLRILVEGSADYRTLRSSFILEGSEQELLNLELWRTAYGLLSVVTVDGFGNAVPEVPLTFKVYHDHKWQERQITTDDQGRFLLNKIWRISKVEVTGSALSMVDLRGGKVLSHMSPLATGGWSDMRVMVLPSASLEVRVVDSDGLGIEGAHVRVELDETESATLDLTHSFWGGPHRSAKTDSTGRACVPDLWAKCRLKVQIGIKREGHWAERVQGQQLVFGEEYSGSLIILEVGENKQLLAQWGRDHDIQGFVVDAFGNPAAGCAVSVYDGGATDPFEHELLQLESDSQGAFEGRLRQQSILGPLLLVARLTHSEPSPSGALTGLGYLGGSPTSDEPDGATSAGAVEVALSRAVDGVFTVQLQVAPLEVLEGVVHGPNGGPIEITDSTYRVWVVPAGGGFEQTTTAVGRISASIDAGRFRFWGLPAGPYDIYVLPRMSTFHSQWNSMVCFPNQASGQRDLRLTLPDRGLVKIKIRVHGARPQTGPRNITVLHRSYYPTEAETYPKSMAPHQQTQRNANSWPIEGLVDFLGNSLVADAFGQSAFGMYSVENLEEHQLSPCSPGWYSVGVDIGIQQGTHTSLPMGTELQYFEAGEYTIDFHLSPGITIAGRIGSGRPLAIAVLDSNGSPVPLRAGSGEAANQAGMGARPRSFFMETNAHGGFVLRGVPIGKHRVRVGELGALIDGSYLKEFAVDFRTGMSSLVLDM